MFWKTTLIYFVLVTLVGCSPSGIIIDRFSESAVSELNNELQVLKTKVYLTNGDVLKEGEFMLSTDSLTHSINGNRTKYPVSIIQSIKTIDDHSSSTILGLSLMGGGVAVFAVTPEKKDWLESPNDVRELQPITSKNESLTDRLKGNLLGSVLSVSGLIVLISGINRATRIYIIK